VRSVGVNDGIWELIDQFADPKPGQQVNFSPHGHWKNVHTGPDRPILHRGTGLADQVTGNSAFIQTHQQIQGLLLTPPPGTLGVDVKDLHIKGH